MHELSVVIPVYKSALILPALLQRLHAVLPTIASQYEVILVCDGSPDNSWEVICDLARQYPFLKGVNLARNYGQHNAVLMGIREARHEIIVTMDDDLQHPPEEIHKLLAKLDEGHDVVYGYPINPQHHSLKNYGSRYLKWLLEVVMKHPAAQYSSSFRVLRKNICKVFDNYSSDYVHIDAALNWATQRFSWVEVRHDARCSGISNYTFKKLLLHTIHVITGYSVLPLQVASVLGLICTFFGVSLFVYVVWSYLVSSTLQGFTFLAATIALFAGIQMFCLGIIGAYLARTHLSALGKPAGMIKEKTR